MVQQPGSGFGVEQEEQGWDVEEGDEGVEEVACDPT